MAFISVWILVLVGVISDGGHNAAKQRENKTIELALGDPGSSAFSTSTRLISQLELDANGGISSRKMSLLALATTVSNDNSATASFCLPREILGMLNPPAQMLRTFTDAL